MQRRPHTSEKTLPGTGKPPSPGYFARQARKRRLAQMTPESGDEGGEDLEQSLSTRRTRRKVYHITNDREETTQPENEETEAEPVITVEPLPPTPASPVANSPDDETTTTTTETPRQKRKYTKKPKYTHLLPGWFLEASTEEQFRMTGTMMQHAYKAQLAKIDEAAAAAIRTAKSQKGIERGLNALLEPGKMGVLPVPVEVLERRMRNTWRTEVGKAAEAVKCGQVMMWPVVCYTTPDAWVPKLRKGQGKE